MIMQEKLQDSNEQQENWRSIAKTSNLNKQMIKPIPYRRGSRPRGFWGKGKYLDAWINTPVYSRWKQVSRQTKKLQETKQCNYNLLPGCYQGT